MKFEFQAMRGGRVMRYFRDATMTGVDIDDRLWWNITMRLWEPLRSHKNCLYSTHAKRKTFKAFKRMLRKHPHIIGKCVLISRYKGYNIKSVNE